MAGNKKMRFRLSNQYTKKKAFTHNNGEKARLSKDRLGNFSGEMYGKKKEISNKNPTMEFIQNSTLPKNPKFFNCLLFTRFKQKILFGFGKAVVATFTNFI